MCGGHMACVSYATLTDEEHARVGVDAVLRDRGLLRQTHRNDVPPRAGEWREREAPIGDVESQPLGEAEGELWLELCARGGGGGSGSEGNTGKGWKECRKGTAGCEEAEGQSQGEGETSEE